MSQPATAPRGRGLIEKMKTVLGLGSKLKSPRKIAIEYAPLVVRGSPDVTWICGATGAGATTLVQELCGYFADRDYRIVMLDFDNLPLKEWSQSFPVPPESLQTTHFNGLGDTHYILRMTQTMDAMRVYHKEQQLLFDALMEQDLSRTVFVIDRYSWEYIADLGPLLQKIRETDGARAILSGQSSWIPELMNMQRDARIWMRSSNAFPDVLARESDLFHLVIKKQNIELSYFNTGVAVVSLPGMAHRVTFPPPRNLAVGHRR